MMTLRLVCLTLDASKVNNQAGESSPPPAGPELLHRPARLSGLPPRQPRCRRRAANLQGPASQPRARRPDLGLPLPLLGGGQLDRVQAARLLQGAPGVPPRRGAARPQLDVLDVRGERPGRGLLHLGAEGCLGHFRRILLESCLLSGVLGYPLIFSLHLSHLLPSRGPGCLLVSAQRLDLDAARPPYARVHG